MVLLCICLMGVAHLAHADEPYFAHASDMKSWFGFGGVLLGAVIYDEWVSANDLQEKEEYHFLRLWGGHECKVYTAMGGRNAIISAMHGEHPEGRSPADNCLRRGSSQCLDSNTGQTVDSRMAGAGLTYDLLIEEEQRQLGREAAVLAIKCDFNPMPRDFSKMDTSNVTYRDIVKQYLARNGMPNASAKIAQLYKVDLEGDGVDEVVICAQNIVEPKLLDWGLHVPLTSAQKGFPNAAQKGQYSIILLRKIVDGQVREIPLAQFIALKDGSPIDEQWIVPELYKVYHFADLNNDGVMEIIVGQDYYEGFSYCVYEVKDGRAVKVLENGVGH